VSGLRKPFESGALGILQDQRRERVLVAGVSVGFIAQAIECRCPGSEALPEHHPLEAVRKVAEAEGLEHVSE
jgi:hypothetical protein